MFAWMLIVRLDADLDLHASSCEVSDAAHASSSTSSPRIRRRQWTGRRSGAAVPLQSLLREVRSSPHGSSLRDQNECDALANRASCEAHPVAHVNTRQGLPLDRAWSLMPRDYGCCGTEKPAKRGEVESALRLGQRPAAAAAPAAALMYRPSHNLASCGRVSC